VENSSATLSQWLKCGILLLVLHSQPSWFTCVQSHQNILVVGRLGADNFNFCERAKHATLSQRRDIYLSAAKQDCCYILRFIVLIIGNKKIIRRVQSSPCAWFILPLLSLAGVYELRCVTKDEKQENYNEIHNSKPWKLDWFGWTCRSRSRW